MTTDFGIALILVTASWVNVNATRGFWENIVKFHVRTFTVQFPRSTLYDLESPAPHREWVLLTLGGSEPGNGDGDDVEIYDFELDKTCRGVKLPMGLDRPTVTYTNGMVLICGGRAEVTTKKCWTYDKHMQTWVPRQDMKQAKYGASGTNIHNGHHFWMTGGGRRGLNNVGESQSLGELRRTFYETLDVQTEIYTDNNYWTEGPKLRSPVKYHCTVQINECETAIVGGQRDYTDGDENGFRHIDIYNWNTETWRTGPTLVSDHELTSCALIHDPQTMHPVVVVMGEDFTTQELWDTVADTVTVVSDQQMPSTSILRLVALNKFEVAIVSSTQGIYAYSISNGIRKIRDHTFTRPEEFDAVLVPKDYIKCRDEI